MRYRNTKTGAIISSPCKISGGDWVLEGKRKEPKTLSEPVVEKVEQIEEIEHIDDDDVVDLSKMSIAEIRSFAEANDIDLGKAKKKNELLEVIANSGIVEVEEIE